jgi:hypothetical protein
MCLAKTNILLAIYCCTPISTCSNLLGLYTSLFVSSRNLSASFEHPVSLSSLYSQESEALFPVIIHARARCASTNMLAYHSHNNCSD